MMGVKDRVFSPLPHDVSLEDLVPKDNFYRGLEERLDLSFVREMVGPLYARGGRPSVDPVVFFKLQLVMFFEGVRSERQLMRMAADRLSVRWYLGYDLFEPLPDHSNLTRTRERFGLPAFRRFFEEIVGMCVRAGLVRGDGLFFDSTKVEANAAVDSLAPRWAVEAYLGELFEEEMQREMQRDLGPAPGGGAAAPIRLPVAEDEVVLRKNTARKDWLSRDGAQDRSFRNPWRERTSDTRASRTDPDATPMTWAGSGRKLGYQSVRIPASFSGLFGMKASMGRVPLYPSCRDERYPGASGWESLEHTGPMSRTVRDGALMLSVMAGPDDRDRLSIPKEPGFDPMGALGEKLPRGLHIAYSPDWGYAAVDPEVRRVVGEAVKVFENDLGCTVEEAHPGFEDPFEAFWGLVLMETDLAGMRKMAKELGEKMSPHLVAVLEQDWKAEDFTNAVMARKHVYNKMWRFMRDYDLLLTPTLAVAPFETGIQGPEVIEGREVPDTYWLSFTFPINMTGQPAATVPAGFTQGGLPVGLQIVGRHLDDGLVLRASAAFEAARPWKDRWPGKLLEEVGL